MGKYTLDQLSRMIDHTNLKADADCQAMELLCTEAKGYHFKMVAINQVQAKVCAAFLKGTDINVGAAISFPLGQTSLASKLYETVDAIKNGATEIDYVINLTEVKNGNFNYIQEEMSEIVMLCKKNKVISKVIFENAYLSKEEIAKIAEIAKIVEPDFIKTSTGMAPSGATLEDVALMKQVVGSQVKVKAAGGIRDAETFKAMIKNGAERIGTSSGIQILKELTAEMTAKKQDFIEI